MSVILTTGLPFHATVMASSRFVSSRRINLEKSVFASRIFTCIMSSTSKEHGQKDQTGLSDHSITEDGVKIKAGEKAESYSSSIQAVSMARSMALS